MRRNVTFERAGIALQATVKRDVVWELKYWGLRTLNNDKFELYIKPRSVSLGRLCKKGGNWDEARRRIQDGGWSGGFQSDGISALKIWLEQALLKFGVLETCEGIFEEGTDNIYFAYNDLSLFIVSLRCIKSADMDSTCKCFLLYIHIS